MRIRTVIAATLGVMLPLHAGAEIISFGGSTSLIPRPADAQNNVLKSNTMAFVWNEAQGITLSEPVTIDAAEPGDYDSAALFIFDSLPVGSVVSSHHIHFDTEGGSTHAVDGSATFDADILGVICWNRQTARHLGESDDVFGLGTVFSTEINNRGVFDSGNGTGEQNDWFSISSDRRTIEFHLQVSTPFDQIRVVTAIPGQCGSLCAEDISLDCVIDLTDLSILLSHFGECSGDPDYFPPADIDQSGCVDLSDLSLLLTRFGDACD